MKVLHLSSEKSWRGGEQQIAYLIEDLEKLNFDNFIACKKGSAFENYCRENGLHYFSLPFKGGYDLYTAYEIKNFCKYMEIDVIHIHSSHSHTIAVLSSILSNKTPMVLSRRVDFPLSSNFFSQFKYNHRSIKKIICVSEKIREIIAPHINSTKKLTTIYDGINLNRFQGKTGKQKLRKEFSIPENKLIVGNISAIAPHKDYFTFVDTAEKCLIKGINAAFVIIGDGPERKEIETYIKNKNLQEVIYLTGFRNDVEELMPELDIFLMTSKTEGLGSTILDAFVCRIPVVATQAGGIPEIVIHEKTGLLAATGDSDNLAEAVIRLINNQEFRNNLIDNASEKVKEFSKEEMARKTAEVYHSISKKKPRKERGL